MRLALLGRLLHGLGPLHGQRDPRLLRPTQRPRAPGHDYASFVAMVRKSSPCVSFMCSTTAANEMKARLCVFAHSCGHIAGSFIARAHAARSCELYSAWMMIPIAQ